jgi:glyoxylase-like metal-dependent hydrolase (beta-lactamase superfamily II)
MTGAAADTFALPPAPEVRQLEVGLLQNFCEVLFCPQARAAAVVDPAWEVDRLLRLCGELAVKVTTILITHTHNDHIDGVQEMVERTGARVFVHPHEAARVAPLAQEIVAVSDRMDIAIGQTGVRVLETFGHTAGGVSFLADGFVVTGDVLFVGGCGRTDLPGGKTDRLWQSLARLASLPEETRVYPGHNYGPTPTSTIGHELLTNPFLRCVSLDAFRQLRERARKA